MYSYRAAFVASLAVVGMAAGAHMPATAATAKGSIKMIFVDSSGDASKRDVGLNICTARYGETLPRDTRCFDGKHKSGVVSGTSYTFSGLGTGRWIVCVTGGVAVACYKSTNTYKYRRTPIHVYANTTTRVKWHTPSWFLG